MAAADFAEGNALFVDEDFDGAISAYCRAIDAGMATGLTVGLMIFAIIGAVFVRMLTTGNPDEQHFQKCMDALNFMMRDTRMPLELRRRVAEGSHHACTLSPLPLISRSLLLSRPFSLSPLLYPSLSLNSLLSLRLPLPLAALAER